MGAFLGFVWCFERLFVRAPCGRKRFNVLAALNAITHEVITVTNDSYINALSVCELLEKLATLGLSIPITLVLDNARYQKCQLVQDLAHSLGIELLFLPSYSPNLNLIERFWKFVKQKCLYSKYYEDFTLFQDAISSCIENAHINHKKELLSLLTLRFQNLKKAQIMPVQSITSTGFYSLFQTLPLEIWQGFLQLLFQNNSAELEDSILYLACENSRNEGFLSELESQSLLESLPQ